MSASSRIGAARRAPFEKLGEHHRKQAQFPLDILVWGPAPGESIEYQKRCEIRDALRGAGHNAEFSEDLMPDDVEDPLDEELLQADSAHLIVVLYASRGVQTEVDTLLGYQQFALKALVFIDEDVRAKTALSVAKGIWTDLERLARKVVCYTQAELEACAIVGQACAIAEQLRRAAYLAEFRRSLERP